MDLKKVGVGIATVAALAGGGTVATDQVINPYTDTGTKLEVVDKSITKNAGDNTVLLDKAKPAITLEKWNGQEALGVEYKGVQASGSRAFLTDRMEWKTAAQEVHAYPVAATSTMEDGGFELEVVLNSKPATTTFPFSISGYEDMNFNFQGALVPQQQGDTCTPTLCTHANGEMAQSRPENVVGSYAVYSKSRRDQAPGGLNYSTGKLFQIFRPKATDANGNWTWANLSYDGNGTLTVSVPQKFLDTATYPVVVDPTFGRTAQGGSSFAMGGGSSSSELNGKYTLSGTSANVSEIHAWYQYGVGTENPKPVFIGAWRADRPSGFPGTCITQPTCSLTLNITNTSFADDLIATAIPGLVAGDYWVGSIPDSGGPGSGTVALAYDTTGGVSYDVGDSFPTNPFTCGANLCATTGTNFYSYYFVYTAVDITPVLSAASVSPGFYTVAGGTFTFSATWSDADSSGVHTFVCKAPTTSTSGCDGSGTWASYTSTFDSTNPKTLTYASTDPAGIYQAYVFVCDASSCSNVIQTYFVIRPFTSNVIQTGGITAQKNGKIIQP